MGLQDWSSHPSWPVSHSLFLDWNEAFPFSSMPASSAVKHCCFPAQLIDSMVPCLCRQSLLLPPHHPLAGKGHTPPLLAPWAPGPQLTFVVSASVNSQGRAKEGQSRSYVSAHCWVSLACLCSLKPQLSKYGCSGLFQLNSSAIQQQPSSFLNTNLLPLTLLLSHPSPGCCKYTRIYVFFFVCK